MLNVEKVNDEDEVNHSVTPETDVISKIHNVGEYTILPNGLLNSIQYYIILQSEHVKIGIYNPKINIPLVVREFQISAKQFSLIANKYRFVDSNAIDCYTATHMDEWKDRRISYLPTDVGNKAIGSFTSQGKSPSSDMYKITTPLKENLLMSYIYHGHSALLVVNIKEETSILLDPYETSNVKDRVFKAFYAYIESCKPPCSLSDLKYVQ